jgi:hypothetical protein
MAFGHSLFLVKMSKGKIQKTTMSENMKQKHILYNTKKNVQGI